MDDNELKSYLERTDISIEGHLAKWDVAVSGEFNGLYTGTFMFKCFLTPSEKLAAGRDYRDLLGPNAVLALEHEESLAFMLSQLKYRVVSGPPFWISTVGLKGIQGDIPDEPVLNAIFEAALSAEFKYLALLKEKKEKALEKAKKVAEKIAENKDKDIDKEPE